MYYSFLQEIEQIESIAYRRCFFTLTVMQFITIMKYHNNGDLWPL